MNTSLTNSTRRHPRTLSDAFADERAEWFEPPVKAAKADKAVVVTLGLAVLFLMALLTWEQFL